MVIGERNRNRDGSTLSSNEYAAYVLAVLVPIVGLLFGIYMNSERNPHGKRVILISIVSTVIWLSLVFAF